MTGRFITVEGIEGSGKSTCIQVIREVLERQGKTVLCTREPGGTPLAEAMRALLLKHWDEPFDAQAELLLVFAARAQHLHTRIEPALDAGQWVVSDRFTDATYAYQGGGRGLSKEMIGSLEQMVQGKRRPDMTLLLTVDPERGMARARARAELDRFESETIAFYERVQSAYLERARQEPDRFVVIDSNQPLEKVQEAIRRAILSGL
ncbi:dTMP kinase [Hahella sp. SMD15-11]|uniref:Thymidylate kinase n=1 Tax=Thermohahella caldifontis TaxID=3142973 RepID=A0AB39UYS5_9GAMM